MKTKILSYTTVSVTYLLSIGLCELLQHRSADSYVPHHSNGFFLVKSCSAFVAFGSKSVAIAYHNVDSMPTGIFVALGLCLWLILCAVFNAYCKKRQEKSFIENYRRFSFFTFLYGFGAFVSGSILFAVIDKICETLFEYRSRFSGFFTFGANMFVIWILFPILIGIAVSFIVSKIANASKHRKTKRE